MLPENIKKTITEYLNSTPPRINELGEYLASQIPLQNLESQQIHEITQMIETAKTRLAKPEPKPDNG